MASYIALNTGVSHQDGAFASELLPEELGSSSGLGVFQRSFGFFGANICAFS